MDIYTKRVALDGSVSTLLVRVGQSWMALKTWIKLWLFFLNALFLGAFIFLYHPVSRWILVAYISSGAILVPIALFQQGLSRILGLGHILPWLPLLVYLVFALYSDGLDPSVTLASDLSLFLVLDPAHNRHSHLSRFRLL